MPIVWRLARPLSKSLAAGAVCGFIAMALMALGQPASSAAAGPAYGLLFVAGLAEMHLRVDHAR